MTKESATKYVIFDTDMGSDDAWALQLILKAEKHLNNVKLLAITTVNGNTTVENAIKNTYRLLDGLNRTDISIHKGATEALIPNNVKLGEYHGSNGFCDVNFWHPDIYPSDINSIIHPKNAVDIIRDLIIEYPHRISLICLGPLTNIALAIKIHPEIRDKIGDIFIMGGNYKGVGNASACAEFNFHEDPEAAHIVLNSLNCPISIVPWECCTTDVIKISKEWRFKALENTNCRNVQLLNEIDKICYRNEDCFIPCDAFLAAIFLFPDKCIQSQKKYNANIELHGNYTRGQMIIDHRQKENHNVTVIEMLNEEEFKKVFYWAATI